MNAEYARIDNDGTWYLNLKRRGWVRLESLLDQADEDRKAARWALGIAMAAGGWSLIALLLIIRLLVGGER